ncbi:MSCRAMM family protein, partial [Marinilactibacillus kalidii]|uniref:MSCRAMM family protein n=1 Tax=Marinilactibacillus kalidii TaxID=2820274 RepID=UPI001ABDC886
MKRIFSILAVFMITFTQFSHLIAAAQAPPPVDISVKEVNSENQDPNDLMLEINVANDADRVDIYYSDGVDIDEDNIKNTGIDYSLDKQNRKLSINRTEMDNPFRVLFNYLNNQSQSFRFETYRGEELVDTIMDTYQNKNEMSSEIEETANESSENSAETEEVSKEDDEAEEPSNNKTETEETATNENSENTTDESIEAEEPAKEQVENAGEINKNNQSPVNYTQKFISPASLAGNLNVDIALKPLEETVQAGKDAVYTMAFKVTGSRTAYTNAKIRVALPDSEFYSFDQPLSELTIASVEPVFNSAKNELVYNFDTLKTGQTYERNVRLSTANGVTPKGTTLPLTVSFEADEQPLIDETRKVEIDSSTSISLSKSYIRTRNSNSTVPLPNTQTLWNVNANIGKQSVGQSYLQEGSQIVLTDTLPAGLTYIEMLEGPEPDEVNGNQLIWRFDAPTIDEQENLEEYLFNRTFQLVLRTGSNTGSDDGQPGLENSVSMNATFVGDIESSSEASDIVKVYKSNPSNDKVTGNIFVPTHSGPIDDEGNIAPLSNKNPNIVVYDDALLRFDYAIAPLYESEFGDFREYETRYDIDSNLILERIKTPGGFAYRPNAGVTPGLPLKRDPVYTIDAIVNGQRRTLVADPEDGRTYNRNDLGLTDSDKVSAVFYNFTYAPSGMINVGKPEYEFSVKPGYVGQVENKFDVYGYAANGRSFGREGDVRKYNSRNELATPRQVQIAARPKGQPPIGTVQVNLEDQSGSRVEIGPNRMRVDLRTESTSPAAMTEPLSVVVLMPAGTKVSDSPEAEFVDAEGLSSTSTSAQGGSFEILDDNYNGTGRQLVQFNWNDRLLRPGKQLSSSINVEIEEGVSNLLRYDVYGYSGDEEITVPDNDEPGLTDTTLQSDTDDLDRDGNSAESRLRSANEYYISGLYDVQTEKLVRGELDEAYSTFGQTVPGGAIDYRFNITNSSGKVISYMTMIDVLPSVGDLGITDNIDRGSQFTPLLTGPITVPNEWQDRVTVYYSTASNPERDELTRNTDYPESTTQLTNPTGAEAPNWMVASAVSVWSDIRSFKIELNEGTAWVDGEAIVLDFSMQSPQATDVDPSVFDRTVTPTARAAWNSFALATDEGQPVEPERVGVYMNNQNTIRLTKVDPDGERLSGAVFSLTAVPDTGAMVPRDSAVLITDSDGLIEVNDLAPGTYRLQETRAPYGYEANGFDETFEVTGEQNALYEFEAVNQFLTSSVRLTKTGQDGALLEGVEFELQTREGETLRTDLFTDENGVLLVENLTPGTYQLVEQSTLPGYELDQTPQRISVLLGVSREFTIDFENEPSPGDVELIKVGPEGETLEGAVFRLEDAEGNELQTGLTTNEQGRLLVEDLDLGDYRFIETQAPYGYELDDTPIDFTITFNQTEPLEIRVDNEYTPAVFELTKTGEDGELLAGVTFNLVDSEGNMLREGLVTNDAGVLRLEDLTPGDYQLIEQESIPGYELDQTPIPFSIGLGQDTVGEVTFENELTRGSVELTKVNPDGEALEGAAFRLEDAEGNELETG